MQLKAGLYGNIHISDIILDLSYPLSASDSQSNWPGVTPFQKTTVKEGYEDSLGGHFVAFYDINMGEHFGTHMDAPFHFNPRGWSTDQIPLDR